jgi:hypothetical protein
LRLGGGLPYTRLVGFFVIPSLLIAVSIVLGWVLRYAFPGLFALMTGGRGTGREPKNPLQNLSATQLMTGGRGIEKVGKIVL